MRDVSISGPGRLEDGVVVVRPLRGEDAGPYAGAFRDDPALGRLLGIEADPDESSVRERIERQPSDRGELKFLELAIADPATDAFCGVVLVHSLHDVHRRGEVGFWIVPDRRRRGLASRAVALVISWLFTEGGLLRVEMTTTPDNEAVPVLARRLGFTREGVLRSRNVERGRRVDIVWFGLLCEEWQGG
jgi:RimJ/RimL family protein N-acetyltransferase